MILDLSTEQAMDILLQDKGAAWSVDDARALVEYYDELGDDLGKPVEMDRVAIRCEWSAYSDWIDYAEQYFGGTLPDWEAIDRDALCDAIRDACDTVCIEHDSGILVMDH